MIRAIMLGGSPYCAACSEAGAVAEVIRDIMLGGSPCLLQLEAGVGAEVIRAIMLGGSPYCAACSRRVSLRTVNMGRPPWPSSSLIRMK